jgi:hypothetical protein
MTLFIFFTIQVTNLIALTVLLIHFRSQPKAFRWLAFLIFFSLACDLAAISALFLSRTYGASNIAGNIHTLFNPMFLSAFFFHLIGGRRFGYILIILNSALFAFSLANLSLDTPTHSNFNTLAESFLILSLSIIYYFRLLKQLPSERVQLLPAFWVVCGFFISTSGKLIIFTVSSYMIKVMPENLRLLVIIHNLLSILGNLLIIYGLWLQFKQFRFFKNEIK